MSLNGAIAEAVVLIRADGTTFQNDVAHEGSIAGTRAGSAFGDQFKRRAKATLAVGGAAIFAGLAATARTGFTEVKDYEAGLAKLKATFKATRTDVGLTVPQLERLASRIEAYSGQTDDSIVAAETQLKTFKAVRDELGKGNDLFTRATKASADMSAQWGGDASQNAIKLGKALNDPIAGATALSKIGVQFTAEQKEQIKTLVDHNHALRAQKLVLGEVEGQAKGVARAYGQSLPGQIDRTTRAYEGVAQELATDLLPYALDFSKWIRKDALPALEDFGGWVKDHRTELEWFAGILGGAAISVKAFKGIRSLQALVGRGALGGGGLLGAASLAKPVPVFVTNPGGLPGTGKGPAPVGGKTPWWKSALPAPAVLAAAYFGTQGGDQAPGQNGPAYGSPEWLRTHPSAASRLALINNPTGGFGHSFPSSVRQGDSINVPEAAQFLRGTGTAEQVKQLKELADTYPAVRAGLAAYNKEQRDLNQLLGVAKGKVADADSASHHFATTLFGLAKNASNAGRGVGVDFGQGVVDGLHSKDDAVRQAAHYQASQLEKLSLLAIEAGSPSKVARRIGNYWDDGLIQGLRDKQRDIDKLVSDQMGQLGNLRGRAQALASGVTGAILGDSSILNTPNQTVGGIKSYFRHVLDVDRRFDHRIDRLRDMHLRKGLVNELEQAGPIAAGNLVRQLVRADRGDRHDVGRLYGNIHDLARRAGQTARQETYDPQIQGLQRSLDGLRDDLRDITRRIDGAENKHSARTHR